jgi:hypothetical protein
MTFRSRVDSDLESDVVTVRQSLGLDPAAREFRIAYGAIAADDREIAILSRSMLEIIVDLGSYIEVPPADVESKRVNATMPLTNADGSEIVPLIRISSSKDRPSDSFIAIPYRGHWFWIDDRDIRSKAVFTFLMFVFSLTETQGNEGAPIVTIPAG